VYNKNKLVIGIGNPFRGDDGAGLILAAMLRERDLPGTVLIEANGDVSGLMDAWKDAAEVILVDAVFSGAKAGTIFRFDASHHPLPRETFASVSTHSFSLADSIELARALGQLPAKVIVYGIEGKDFSARTGLTPEVERATNEALKRILADVGVAVVSES